MATARDLQATRNSPADNPAGNHTGRPTSADRRRQLGVTLAEVLCIYGTLLGVGVIGTRVEESSGGALAADATLLAPATPAFSIWSVIYLGLAAYTIWQWLPANATSPRARATGWLIAVSMLLNAGWLLVTQQGWIWASVVIIVALALTLGVILARLTAIPPAPTGRTIQRVIVDGTMGLYLGWVAVATCANITAALVATDVELAAPGADIVAVIVLAVAAGLGVLFARRLGGRYAVAAAMAWGLVWIAVGRTTDAPVSRLVTIGAVTAAVIVVLGAAAARHPAARRG
ncbi:MAG TPA: tryptophan-rich sensory protein [Phycicoccus sp.]|nr:tryptophan-rich sensory protein [Phycicoccus sp.]